MEANFRTNVCHIEASDGNHLSFVDVTFQPRYPTEGIEVSNSCTEIVGVPDHEGGVVGESLTSDLLLGKVNTFNVFNKSNLDEDNLYHEN